MLSERYIEWRRRKSRRDFYAWVDRWNEADARGEKLKEQIPNSVDIETMLEYGIYLLYHHKSPSNGTNGSHYRADSLADRERRILEVEAWYGRKYLAEERGETFDEPFPQDKNRV